MGDGASTHGHQILVTEKGEIMEVNLINLW